MRLTTLGVSSQLVQWINDYMVDRGTCGLTPLARHIVICGCPRAGSTLLHLMLSVALTARTFGKERRALDAAMRALRNHATMLTKRPNDIFELDRIRHWYRPKRAHVLFLVNIRDPRDILVSRHATRPDAYYVTPQRWGAIFSTIESHRQDPDVHIVRFEDLVCHLSLLAGELETFLGLRFATPLDTFHHAAPRRFKMTALNGLRKLDTRAIGRWREDQHHARIEQMFHDIPGLSDQLRRWGYDTDASWSGVVSTK